MCEGKIHLFSHTAKPGDRCMCGATVWEKKVQKAEGPTSVDEELRK